MISDQCADGAHDECWWPGCTCPCHDDQLPVELVDPCRWRPHPRRVVNTIDTKGLT
jgi:hypothetical protein